MSARSTRPPRLFPSLPFFVALAGLSLGGCARDKPLNVTALLRAELRSLKQPAAHRPAKLQATQRVDGAWDLVERRGLSRPHGSSVEIHELHLRWLDGALVGTWDLERRLTAAPGQVYRATGSARCSERRRLLLTGRPGRQGVRLERIHPFDHQPRCHTDRGLPRGCVLRREGRRLALRCDGEVLTFTRRRQEPLPLMLALAGPGGLTGIWTWHHRSVDPEGDLKIEHETWHLFQNGRQVEGFYDRVVRIRSRDGRPFSCNEALGYANAARFRVRGLVVGGEVYLKEISYTTATSDCETGRRRLDRYIGKLGKGGRIQLRWPSGAQLLHRRR
jgi:hypothetical protein